MSIEIDKTESGIFTVTQYAAGKDKIRLQITSIDCDDYILNISSKDALELADILYGWATGTSINKGDK